jgi:hypothetical protein
MSAGRRACARSECSSREASSLRLSEGPTLMALTPAA